MDSLLIFVNPEGKTCHTGQYSCFGLEKKEVMDFLPVLASIIKDRRENMPENSYTTQLFREGENRIIQKVGEEAIETIIAAKTSQEELLEETSDLIYHLLVLLELKGLSLNEISENLRHRHKK